MFRSMHFKFHECVYKGHILGHQLYTYFGPKTHCAIHDKMCCYGAKKPFTNFRPGCQTFSVGLLTPGNVGSAKQHALFLKAGKMVREEHLFSSKLSFCCVYCSLAHKMRQVIDTNFSSHRQREQDCPPATRMVLDLTV